MILRAPITIFTIILTNLILITSTAHADYDPPYRNLEGLSPNRILGIYWLAMNSMNADPNLPIYTKATREWKQTWTVTKRQMLNSSWDLKKCGTGETIYGTEHAVIRYHVKNRECNPYYFKMEDDAWRLDFLTMKDTIRFNQKNQWHFSTRDHEYMFAFTDWKLDKNGYPHER